MNCACNVGGKRGVWRGAHIHRFQLAVGFDLDPVVARADPDPGFAQLVITASSVSGWAWVVRTRPPVMAAATRKGRSRCGRPSPNTRRMQAFDAVDGDDVRCGSFDFGAHRTRHARQVDSFGLTRGFYSTVVPSASAAAIIRFRGR